MDGPISPSQLLYKKQKKRSIVFKREKELDWLFGIVLSKRKKGKSFFFSYGHYWIGIQSMLPEYIRATRLLLLLLLLVLLCISFHVIFDLSYGTHTPDGQVLFLSLLHITSRRGLFLLVFSLFVFFLFSPVRYYPLYFSNKLLSNKKKKTKSFERLYILKQLREIQGLLCLRTFHNKPKSISIKLEGAQHGSPFFLKKKDSSSL